MIRDVLQHAVDAAGNQLKNLGRPTEAGDATFTDNVTPPSLPAPSASPGASRLAAAADHVHPDPAPTRIVAHGTTTIAAGARVTLAQFKRAAGEAFPPGGFVFVKDDKDGVTWENEVTGADDIATYHERTGTRDELRFRGFNGGDKPRTIEWATVALSLPPN
jgi:hypothetical protein